MMHAALIMMLLAAPAQPQNLLVNGSMEYWHPSQLRPQAWGAWTPDAQRMSWRVSRDEQIVRDGRASMRLDVADWVNAFSSAAVQPGETYTYSIYVHCDKPVKVGMKLSVGGDDVAPDDRDKNRTKPVHDIAPNQWQRIAVTDTMPAGATRVTAYLLLRGEGVYHLDMGMLNVGSLVDYVPGRFYEPIAPLGRPALQGETKFSPQRWDAAGVLIGDQETAFAFDADMMSAYRLFDLPGAVGAVFEKPVTLRGLSLLLRESGKPDDVNLTLEAKQGGVWAALPYELKPVGAISLLAFEPTAVEAIRIRFESDRKLLRIHHIGFAQ